MARRTSKTISSRKVQLHVEALEERSLLDAAPGSIELSFLGRFTTGLGAGAAEIVTYDPATQRLFAVNAVQRSIDIVDIHEPANPVKVGEITNVQLLGGAPNSASFKNGILALAVEDAIKTNPGKVFFFNAQGTLLNQVPAGALPDMITFTPDGLKVLTANEGEPNSYNQVGSVDPEGSVTIVDISAGVAAATVQTVSFAGFNGQEAALRAQGIRIFGPNASAAQDFEPEYITTDGVTAWVTLQENNAVAIVDVASATVTSLVPLGFKDHSQSGPFTESYTFDNMPLLDNVNGEDIPLGGFSGLTFEGYDAAGNLKFITHTDRGPNGEPPAGTINRPFLIPTFNPEIIRFTLNRRTGQLTLTQRLQLQQADGSPMTGLPNINFHLTNGNLAYNDEVPVDANLAPLGTFDPLGADLEGIVVDPLDGSIWMCDEYRPAIYHFAADGKMINRFVPVGTHAAASVAYTPGTFGLFGTEALPAVFGQRRQNRGFEGIALQGGKIYAIVQSPLRNPTSSSNSVLNARKTVRFVEFDPIAQTSTRQFLYTMDNANLGTTRGDKIGDLAALPGGSFLVVERDDDLLPANPLADIEKKIYKFDLTAATPITASNDILYSGKTLDEMSSAELTAAGIAPIAKTLHTDLAKAGYNTVSKVEGLTVIDAGTIAVINDNDFQVGAANEPIILGLIRTNALDASDRDVPGASNNGIINIQNWPVFGMYQPDAIASFVVGGQTYLITANEGDARDYTGFAEEARVGALDLDNTVFPNEVFLKNNDNLGRLNLTRTLGDDGNDLDYERLHAFGARSFSVWNAAGQLVFDSGSDLEVITAALTPASFNSDGTVASFDTRSDNKGPEPEGVAIGVISGKTYAFIGLERVGGVMVYDVSQPTAPKFIQYISSTPTDLAPEGMLFISAQDSPIGRPLVAVANEVSGTVALFQVEERDLVYNAPAGAGADQMVLRQNGANIELIDGVSQAILLRQRLAATNSITIHGVATEAESLTVDFNFGGRFALPGVVAFGGGAGLGDSVGFVGTSDVDHVALTTNQAVFNGVSPGLTTVWTGVEALNISTGAGDDLLEVHGQPVTATTIQLLGGNDNDTYALAPQQLIAVAVIDSAGTDTLDFHDALAGVLVDLSRDAGQTQILDLHFNVLKINGAIENVQGSEFTDIIFGNASNNIFRGLGGTDVLLGGLGHDVLLGGVGIDVIFGGAGNDILMGGAGNDALFGEAGSDLLIGGSSIHDGDNVALTALAAEWSSARPFNVRKQNLINGAGSVDRLNGVFFLSAATLLDDGVFDLLFGGGDQNWLI